MSNEKGIEDINMEQTEGKAYTKKQKCLGHLKKNILLLLLIFSLIFGIIIGSLIKMYAEPFSARQLMYFRFPGDILMRMLKMLIIPLIVTSLVSGLAGLDAKASGKMGLRAIVYYMATTAIAVILGIVLVISIKPGQKDNRDDVVAEEQSPGNIADSFLDLIRNMLPDNIVEACFRQTKTTQVAVEENRTDVNFTLFPNESWTFVYYNPSVKKEEGMNVLGLVVYSVALGIITSRMGELGKPIYNFCFALAEATMKMVNLVIWYSPIGIMFLVASEIMKMDDPVAELQALGLYIATVLTGLFIHGFIILPLLYFIIVRRNPYKYIGGIVQAMLTAFGTASSAATLPVTYRCLEETNGVDNRVTRFVLPVGATINMDGTALYEAVAAIYIAQLNNIQLNAAQIVAASITATLASVGAASVPQAGLVTMVIVLTAIGLPADQVTKILAIDWMLDRFRTAINVEGDAIGAGIIAHLSRHELKAPGEPNLVIQDEDLDTEDNDLHNGDSGVHFPEKRPITSPMYTADRDGVTNPAYDLDNGAPKSNSLYPTIEKAGHSNEVPSPVYVVDNETVKDVNQGTVIMVANGTDQNQLVSSIYVGDDDLDDELTSPTYIVTNDKDVTTGL